MDEKKEEMFHKALGLCERQNEEISVFVDELTAAETISLSECVVRIRARGWTRNEEAYALVMLGLLLVSKRGESVIDNGRPILSPRRDDSDDDCHTSLRGVGPIFP